MRRAVRRLTPRKASFANLFKGKGWNRPEDANATELAGHTFERGEDVDQLGGLEAADEDSCEESALLSAR